MLIILTTLWQDAERYKRLAYPTLFGSPYRTSQSARCFRHLDYRHSKRLLIITNFLFSTINNRRITHCNNVCDQLISSRTVHFLVLFLTPFPFVCFYLIMFIDLNSVYFLLSLHPVLTINNLLNVFRINSPGKIG